MEKVLFILGSTGVGKSDLAIQTSYNLREKYNIRSEIINADAMQVFEGLDICTNKPSIDDYKLVRHHMFGEVDSMRTDYNVQEYVDQCRELISKLNSSSILPIVVGGTNYYVAALVFDDYLIKNKRKDSGDHPTNDTVEYTYERLCCVDPEAAQKIHPNDTRKIRRYLQIYDETQLPYSKAGSTKQNHTLRYDCRFIYLFAENREQLYNRIDERVHKMVQRGLLDELIRFERKHGIIEKGDANSETYQKGILQSIGFKEFIPYLRHLHNNDGSTINEESRLMILSECIRSLQTATRNYARKQENWFRNKWAASTSPLLGPPSVLYELIVSADSHEWTTKVLPAAITIARSTLGLPHDPQNDVDILSMNVAAPRSGISKTLPWQKFICDICNGRVCNGPQEWVDHLVSKYHISMKKRKTLKSASGEDNQKVR